MLDEIGAKIWVNFWYEKLPNFCYICGLLDHTENDCYKNYQQDQPQTWDYGPMLHAFPHRGRIFTRPNSNKVPVRQSLGIVLWPTGILSRRYINFDFDSNNDKAPEESFEDSKYTLLIRSYN